MRLILITTALIVTACGGGSSSSSNQSTSTPTAPSSTPTAPSSTSASAQTNWLVTHRFVSVTGPDNCWVRAQRARLTGWVFPDLDMTVTRADGSIKIDSPWFESYSGTMSGVDFTARQGPPLEGGGQNCDGTEFLQLPGVSNLSGRFASDDQTLTATESNVYPLNTGGTVTYTWDWQARRR